MHQQLAYLPWNWTAERSAQPCVSDDAADLTYEDIALRTEVLAAQLAEHGIGRGDVVAVMLPNRTELILTKRVRRRRPPRRTTERDDVPHARGRRPG